jgi:Ca2+:H+ antiporter
LNEVEDDWVHHRVRTASSHANPAYSGMRRRSQILRRRGTQPATLSNLEDSSDEDRSGEAELSVHPAGELHDTEHEDATVRAESYDGSETSSAESFTLKVCAKSLSQIFGA